MAKLEIEFGKDAHDIDCLFIRKKKGKINEKEVYELLENRFPGMMYIHIVQIYEETPESYYEFFSKKSREIINDIANYSEKTALYERMKYQREEFERDIHETPDLIYAYMLDRVVNAPTKMHMISSIILLMPVLRRLLQGEKNG